MTGSELYDFVTSLLEGDEMDETTFYTLLNMAKNHVEGRRPWRFLISDDSSTTWSPSDTYATEKSLPAGFIELAPRRPMSLVSTSGSVMQLEPSPYVDKYVNKDKSGSFVIHAATSKYSILGTVDQTYTVHIFATIESTTISSSSSWSFPSRFHALLGYFVSAMQKGGIDYDDIFARMSPENRANAELIISDMELWDDKLQRLELGV